MHGFFQHLRKNSTPIPDTFLSLERRIALALQTIPTTTKADSPCFDPGKTFLLTKQVPDEEKGVIILFLDLPVPLNEKDDEAIYGPFIRTGWEPFLEDYKQPCILPWDFKAPLESLKRLCEDNLTNTEAKKLVEELIRRGIYQHMPYAGEPPS